MNTARFYTMRSCNDDYVPINLENYVADPRLEEIDARLEALYNEEITMEATLSEPEWYVRPDFDEEEEEEHIRTIVIRKETPQMCSECHLEKIIISYDFRWANDNLCSECINLDSMSVYERKGLWS
jgi:hypothetical protein